METQSQFDLSQSLQQWRASLTQSAALRPDDVAELEAHLRDSLAALCAPGLTEEEAFIVATKRLGQPAGLTAEFGKANLEPIRITRLAAR